MAAASPTPQGSSVAGYDPGDHTVAEVLAYVADHPEERDQVRAAEAAGKARTTLLTQLEA